MSVLDMPYTRSRWTKPRLARAAFMAGRGEDAKEIAGDPLVMSTKSAVYDVLRRFGIALTDVPRGNLTIDLGKLLPALESEARRRRQTPEALASSAMRILADDPTLLANVLDDDP